MDALKNFAYSLVATAPSPATSGTSLVVTAGQGSYFPATPFDATIWPSGAQPLNTNAEIVRVTNVSTDTFTITRAQYGTTAQSIAVGYQIAQTVDANLLNQLVPLSTVTTAGDLIVGTGASAVSRLGIGTNGQLLTSNGTTATWATASFAPTASPTFTGTVTLPSSTALTTAVLTAPFETVSSSATALSGSTAAALNASTSSFFNYTANPTAAFTINITNAPTTTGQSVTFAMLVNNGATAYLPLNFTVNGNQAGASSSALPAQGATNNGITTWYQGATAWTAADASTLDSYTFVVICTGSSTWTVLAALTKF